jgi:hypothetical protein
VLSFEPVEPEILRRGKEFHRRVQAAWSDEIAGGLVSSEHLIHLLGTAGVRVARRGRIDIFVGQTGDYVTVVEIKGTDWDRIRPPRISQLLQSHRRQIESYIAKYLDGDQVSVCAGIIYPKSPTEFALRVRIESFWNDRGYQVVWYDDA